MSSQWKKWECPPDMLTVEERLKTLQLTERQQEEISMAYYEYEFKRAATPEQKAAWANLLVRKKSKLIKSNLQESLVEDFQLWLQGRSKYNVKTIKEVKFNPINNKYQEMVRECTPWGNQSLLHLPDVCNWLKLPILNRDKVAKAISVLKMTTPTTLDEAWIYYKYISRAIAVDGEILKEQRPYNVFDYIEKRPTKPIQNPDTGEWETVEDMDFTPYSTNNPSMPKFNEQAYKNNYNYFNNQINMGNMHTIIDENEKFASLTPDDKLLLLIKAMANEEQMEMPGPMPIAQGIANEEDVDVPIARINAAPYFIAEMANTLAAAVGQAMEKANAEQKKQAEEVAQVLQAIQVENAIKYQNANDVLMQEFDRIVRCLDGLREDGAEHRAVNIEALREIKDGFAVFDELLAREVVAPVPIRPPPLRGKPLPPIPIREIVPVEPEVERLPAADGELAPMVIVPEAEAGAVEVPPPVVAPIREIIAPDPIRVEPAPEPAAVPVPVPAVHAVLDPVPVVHDALVDPLPAVEEVPVRAPAVHAVPDPVPVVHDALVDPLPAVEEVPVPAPVMRPEPLPVLREEGLTIPPAHMFPRLGDQYETVNMAIQRTGAQLQQKRINQLVNQTIRTETLVELAKEVDGSVPELIKKTNEEIVKRFDKKITKFKAAVEDSPIVRALLLNPRPGNRQLHEDYIKQVVKITEDGPVSEKLDPLKRIHAHLLKTGTYADTVPGIEKDFLLHRINETITDISTINKLKNADYKQMERLSKDLLQASFGTVGKVKIDKVDEIKQLVRQNEDYGTKGSDIMEAYRIAGGKIEALEKEKVYLSERLAIMQEMLKNADPAIAEKLVQAQASITGYETLIGEQERALKTMTMENKKIIDLEIERDKLITQLTELQRYSSEQATINKEAGEANMRLTNAIKQFENEVNRVNALLVEEQNKLQTKNFEYETATANMGARSNELFVQVTEQQKKINYLMDEGNKLQAKYDAEMKGIIAERESLSKKITGLEEDIVKLNGHEVNDTYRRLESEKKVLELEVLNWRTEAELTKSKLMDESKVSEHRRIELEKSMAGYQEAVKQLDLLRKEKTKLSMDLATREGNMKALEDLVKQENQENGIMAGAYKDAIAESERQKLRLAEFETKYADMQKEHDLAKKQVEDLKASALDAITDKDTELINRKNKIADLEKKLAIVNKEMEGIKVGRLKNESQKVRDLRGEIAELQKQLATNEKIREKIAADREKAKTVNASEIDKARIYISEMEGKYQKSEELKSKLERELVKRRAINNDVEELSDKFLNGLRYMVSDDFGNHLDKFFQYKNNPLAMEESKAGRALIQSWNQLQNFKAQRSRDVETMKKQTQLIKQYETQLVALKQKHRTDTEIYERKILTMENKEAVEANGPQSMIVNTPLSLNYQELVNNEQNFMKNIIEAMEARAGKNALATDEEVSIAVNRKEQISSLLGTAMQERSSLDVARLALIEEREKLLEYEAENINKMNKTQVNQLNARLAAIHRQEMSVERSMSYMEDHINSFTTASTFYNNLIQGKGAPKRVSPKEISDQANVFFTESRRGGIEAAKVSAKNILGSLAQAIRTTPDLLASVPTETLLSYATSMEAISTRLKFGNDPESKQLYERLDIDKSTLINWAHMDPKQKQALRDKNYKHALDMQYEIRRKEASLGESQLNARDDEMPDIDINDPEVKMYAGFAPGVEEQKRQKEVGERLITRSLNREELTLEETKLLEEYVKTYGINTVARNVKTKLKTTLAEQYHRLLNHPEETINKMFTDLNDNEGHRLFIEEGRQLMLKRTLYDISAVVKNSQNDTATEKNAKIVKILAQKTPEILNSLLEGTIYAGMKDKLEIASHDEVLDLMAKYRLKADSSVEQYNETLDVLSSEFASIDPEEFVNFIQNVENVMGKNGPAHVQDLDNPMYYLLKKGDLETAAALAKTQKSTFGVDSDAFTYIVPQLKQKDRSIFADRLSAIDRKVENYENVDTSLYVNALKEMTAMVKRGITQQIALKGKDPYKIVHGDRTPTEIKRFYKNTEIQLKTIEQLEKSHYGSNGKTKANMVTMARSLAKSIVADGVRAFTDVERLDIAEKTTHVFNPWDLRSSLVWARAGSKKEKEQKKSSLIAPLFRAMGFVN